MRYKKQIVSIMTLTILLLLMMSTAMQAVSLVGNISDFKASLNGSQMKLTWSSVSNSAGYNVYVNGTKIGSVNSNEASLIGFSENTNYRLRVTAYDSAKAEVAVSEEIKFTTTTNQTLGQVQNLTVTQANGYVTLNWSKVNNADKYQVFVDVPGFGNVNIGEVTTTNAMLKGFSNGMKYGFSIRACQTINSDNVSYGEKSVAKYITIDINKDDTNNDNNNNDNNNTTTKPDKVNDVTVYDVTETTATVTWKEVNNVDGYDVLLSKNYGSYQTVISKTGNSVALANLSPDSYYRVKVVAYKKINNEKVYGEESSYSAFTTKQEKIVVGDINQINVYDISAKEARVSWSKANNADGYEVLLSKNNGRYETITDTTNRVIALGNLASDSSYRVRIVAYKWVNGRKQYGNQSYAYQFNTPAEKVTVESVRTIYVDSLTKNSAKISWSEVKGATGYNIYFAQGVGTPKYQGSTTNRSYIFSNLKPNTDYQIKIEAYKRVNGKEYTSELPTMKRITTSKETTTTNNTNLAKVTGLRPTVRNRTVTLNWNKTTGAAGYEIDLSIPGIGNIPYYANSNSTSISGITGKNTQYTARVRAYKYVNGVKKYGPYSEVVRFKGN